MDSLLEKYRKVIEIGNITKASNQLNISQPALTMALNKLELELGTQLLIRSKKGIYPTDIGKVVYDYAIRIRNDIENLRKEIDINKASYDNVIKVGMIDDIAQIYAPQIFKQNLNSRVNLYINNTTEILKLLEIGEIDIGIITWPRTRINKKIEIENLTKENLSLCADPSFKNIPKSISELSQIQIITYNFQSNTHKLINKSLIDAGVKPQYSINSTSLIVNIELIKSGLAIGILPDHIIRKNGLVKIFEDKINITRDLAIATLVGSPLLINTEDFIANIRNFFKHKGG